jgi:hypothetical protein
MSKTKRPGRSGEFFALLLALREFKAGPLSDHPSDRGLARAADVSPTTIGAWLRGERFPHDIGKILVVVRMVRAEAGRRSIVTPSSAPTGLLDEVRWRAAHREEAQRRAGVISDQVEHAQAISVLAGPRMRVGEANPRLLGVHQAISVPGVPDEVPPEYVPRDVDAAEFGVRAKVQAAAQQGGFVLLVGGSSVGKTRCAVEMMKVLLPDWWLLHPANPAEVIALAQAPPSQTVVWLDELQRYLDGEHGLTGAVVRALLNATHPVVIIGTLWPGRYTAYTALPPPEEADPNAREREVLDLAAIIRIDPDFSSAEQDRARTAAGRDPRLAIALETKGYGLTQTLAAAPQLVARWRDAETAEPYAWAVLTAALDVARLGARAPLSPDLLRAAAPGYCTSQQQAEAAANWFEQAVAYATKKLHGAAAALTPAGAGMGQLAGYTVADYLVQYATREYRYARAPASTWDAILSYVRNPDDAARIADSARNRLLYRYAISLYRHAADGGDRYADERLTELLAWCGDLEELRARADADDEAAAVRLAGLLAERGELEELRARADAGNGYACMQLAELLARRGDLEELRARADADDLDAGMKLADLLAERGDLEELRTRAEVGDDYACLRLAGLLARRGELEKLRTRADAGDRYADERLAELLARRGELEKLRTHADAGDEYASRLLNELLARRGALDELRVRADAGDDDAAWWLAGRLAGRGELEELRTRADADTAAVGWLAAQLAELLARRGELEELRTRAEAGDRYAARRLAGLLVERGDLDGATVILRTLAATDDDDAAWLLADLLAERGDLKELRARADAGDRYAARRLAELLDERGELDELRARADAGDEDAAGQLARLLADRGDLEELRARADAGDEITVVWLASLLAHQLTMQGRGEEVGRLRRFGFNPDGSIASA